MAGRVTPPESAEAPTIDTRNILFLAGGGILAHPSGAAAGVRALRAAWEAVAAAARAGVVVRHGLRAPPTRRAGSVGALATCLPGPGFFRSENGAPC
mgnify:CR=1 FL=1